MSFQKIFVLGAGAIGSAYGALLSQKNDVTLIGRRTHVEAINRNGLVLSGNVNHRFLVKAETIVKEIPLDTLILLTTKAHDITEAVASLKPLLRKDTVLLVLQNGLGVKALVEKVTENKAEVVRGLVTSAAEFFEPGKISFWQGETLLEPVQTSERIAQVFNESGLKTRIVKDIREELWKKLIINCVVNPLTAIFRVRNNAIMVDSLRWIRHEIIRECVAVGKAEGIRFQENLEELIEQKIAGYTNYSSMCQDILKGKKTEIDFLNAKIVELGKKHGIPTPVNETLVGLVRFLEEQPK
jgi:2-dehydropantoate 2-reductase